MNPVKILVVDDQRLVRDGIASLLALKDDFEVTAVAENGRDALRLYREHRPDIVLMDIRMPVMDGITATTRIREENPEACILMLTTFGDEEYIIKSLKAGAVGYLMKDLPVDDLEAAIRMALKGIFQMDAGIMSTLVGQLDSFITASAPKVNEQDSLLWESFTEREQDVLRHLSQGCTNREIAEAVSLSEGTVKNYVSDILATVGLKDRTRLALWTHKNGWGS